MHRDSGKALCHEKNGRVIIRLPRAWFGGKQRVFSLLIPATKGNLAEGEIIASQINLDWQRDLFDTSLERYRPKNRIILADQTTAKLWKQYCDYKEPTWKAKTIHYNLAVVGRWIERIPNGWHDALGTRTYLMEHTTNGVAVRVLQSIETCINWAMRVGLIEVARNPYQKMGSELKAKGAVKAPPNALSSNEQEKLIAAFHNSERWQHLGNFVEFLFLTGCRPSEAVGLTWEQIYPDCQAIKFNRSIVKIGKEFFANTGSKTNRVRVFPCSDRLTALLLQMRAAVKPVGSVFGEDSWIDYESFCRYAWQPLASEVIGRDSTPYSARDTFITRQIENGKPPVIIAKWVDNSVAMIEKKYLDISAIRSIRPE
jgi:integrase